MLLEHIEQGFSSKRFGEYVIHAWELVSLVEMGGTVGSTMLEIHLDVVASNIRGHGDDRCTVKLPYQVTSRNTIQVGHDDVH